MSTARKIIRGSLKSLLFNGPVSGIHLREDHFKRGAPEKIQGFLIKEVAMRISKRIISIFAAVLVGGTLPALADNADSTTKLRNPKYEERVKNLGEQIQMLEGKGLLTKDETARFMERQSQLSKQEEAVRSGGYQKPETDQLEKSITLLNSDVFRASNKHNPIKPGQAEKEVNDPNLIPAYPDANLQPGSGVVGK
jgi:hypothetical protein